MSATLTSVSTDGRIEIPEDIRRALGIVPNDQVIVVLVNDEIRIRRVAPSDSSDAFWVESRGEWLPWREVTAIAWDEHAVEVERRASRDNER